ncbi:MAG TPA: hypothetical protein VMF53_09890 [Alphaproteobacteria bacterium]|nr:hypothetical protein [Alphaproteobacteria bacterium]
MNDLPSRDQAPNAAPDRGEIAEARRRFLATCGKLAIATPPAVTLMLAASRRNYAVAHSGGGDPCYGDHDPGDHGHW